MFSPKNLETQRFHASAKNRVFSRRRSRRCAESATSSRRSKTQPQSAGKLHSRDVYYTPPGDQYGKCSVFLNAVPSVVDNNREWFKLLHDYFQHFKYHNIMTEDVVAFSTTIPEWILRQIFNQYLRHAAIPILELKFNESKHTIAYRWKVDEPAFAMPVRVGKKDSWQIIRPTTEWQNMLTSVTKNGL